MTTPANETLAPEEGLALAQALGLSRAEHETVVRALGRTPSRSEVSIFAGMWSEHCSYKSTKHLLRSLPRTSPRVLAGPGSHAGVVDVGEGWAVAFKVESHNHPSAVEPYQGAATGIGGILRDVVAEGARPCAVMDALCFGLPSSPTSRRLLTGVVEGIAGYGNAYGVPNVGGSTVFDARYEGNPLVNALAAGLVRPDGLRTAQASGTGNAILYVGARTGRDGILGAAFASEELGDDTVEDRPHVQVGDPFTGKKLMEACLSFTAAEGLVAGQDMGACGLTCAASEMAALGGVGIDLDLDLVPLREADMPAHEILVSESQERFLFVVALGQEERALRHFREQGVLAAIIGRVTDSGRVRARRAGGLAVDLPAALIAEGTPPTRWPVAASLPAPSPYPDFDPPADYGRALCELLALPGIADLAGVYDHYDQTVGNRSVRGPGQASAAVLRLPGSRRGFAFTLLGNGDACSADPYRGTQAVLATTLRNLACAGAELVAITDGLNLGSPRDATENLRLTRVVEGLRDGLTAIGVPVTGGNVSLYNESPRGAIPPTPIIGGLGVVADVTHVPAAGLGAGDALVLLGEPDATPHTSAYGQWRSGLAGGGVPAVDLAAEIRLMRLLVEQAGRVRAARGVGSGGLAVSLAKLCLRGGVGARVHLPRRYPRRDWALFGEPAACAWVSVAVEELAAFQTAAERHGVPFARVGEAGGERLVVVDAVDVTLEDLLKAFSQGGRP